MGEGTAGPGPRSLETRAQRTQGGPVWGGRRWIQSQSLALLPPNCSSSRIPTVPLPHSGLWVQSGFPLGFLSRTEPRLTRSCRGAFRSPRPSPKSGQADGTSEESLHLDIQKLKEKRDMLDKEICQFISEGYSVDELEDHITQLHEYNDIKDVGQMLMGKLAVIRGVTTKELYPEFGLDMND
ncbi:LOW QUALITY PROTEIN: DNA repair protein SWI5 homolog [Symphalangus syndactylus]|uniref:LOW QUALITY PROTEIN: DNA repair protein SWI5 homolog n=1 Tax=Symphalangus syndactylus TaxID=9590 RepID=UPI0024427813|nr:LOW QUALITY PROTEIN: DNA repair protein SWI5 homolog [Symphalangus syndactylus]